MDTKAPQEAAIAVWSQVHNQPMERFAGIRHALTRRTRPASRSRFVEVVPPDRTAEESPDSRLAGILVLLVPVAALTWAAIGLFLYELIT